MCHSYQVDIREHTFARVSLSYSDTRKPPGLVPGGFSYLIDRIPYGIQVISLNDSGTSLYREAAHWVSIKHCRAP